MANHILTTTLDVKKIREDFPVLGRQVRPGVPLIYLDSTATSQKPTSVIETMDRFYRNSNANIHRGIHVLAEEATAAYEEAREKVRRFLNAPSSRQVIFTRNTTEAINLVAYSWGLSQLKSGDIVLLTEMEHHSNLVPWYLLAERLGLRLEYVSVSDEGLLDVADFERKLELKPKLFAFTHMSNVVGTINPAKEMIAKAHQVGAITLLDGAQSVPHFRVDVRDLDVDFLAFSGHKMCGPTGIGVLYGKKDLLEQMPPFLGGGDMIKRVTLGSFKPNELPYKFEAGTPAIAEAIGLGAAIDYLSRIGMDAIAQHEHALVSYALDRLAEIPNLRIFGPSADKKGGVVSFVMDGVHAHDIAQVLDQSGVAIRAGHHCAMPLHEKFQIPATARASFYLYNTFDEIDHLVNAIYRVKDLFGV
ncbi:MAG: cysteine desulfurase [Anaerolineae bacterium]|jgi:cysteine desulfurase/selenocysteine lyase|nr:MAG: cysteine desulfurase [Anaerolineae bacterium]